MARKNTSHFLFWQTSIKVNNQRLLVLGCSNADAVICVIANRLEADAPHGFMLRAGEDSENDALA